ncbi:MAG: hypothetical protein ABMA25_05925 [Ilumatobacteraceae bacterium]
MGSPATPGAAAELARARAALQAAFGHERAAVRLTERIAALEEDLADAHREVAHLRERLQIEEADVVQWSRAGFGPFVYWLIGRLDERRDREQWEAEEASVRLADQADRVERTHAALAAARHELQSTTELARVDDARALVRSLLHDFLPAAFDELERVERHHARIVADLRETEEAMKACEHAIDRCEVTLGPLESALRWGTWDMWGGGLIASSVKHSRVDDGLAHVQQLNAALARLRREAGDVRLSVEVPRGLEAGSGARTLDIWFDNIFSDWNMQDRIERMRDSIAFIGTRLLDVHRQLFDHRGGLLAAEERHRATIDRLYAANG